MAQPRASKLPSVNSAPTTMRRRDSPTQRSSNSAPNPGKLCPVFKPEVSIFKQTVAYLSLSAILVGFYVNLVQAKVI